MKQFYLLKNYFFSIQKKILFLFLLVAISHLAFAQPVGPGDWSSVRLYGHAFALNDFTDADYEWIKDYNRFFTIEKRHARNIYGAVSSERASAATAAKIIANNSAAKPLFYWNTKVVYDYIYETIQEAVALNPDWTDTNGDGGDWTYTDPEFRTWFVDVVKDQVNNQGHAGVFLDAALSVGGHISVDASNHLKDMIAEMPGTVIYSGFGPNNAQFGRFDFLEKASGVFLEHFFRTQCNTLAKGKKMLDDLLQVSNDKIIIANGGPESSFWNTTDHKFSLAAFLIIANENSYFHFLPEENWSSKYLRFWADDFGQYLGAPKGTANVDGYVYTREFENADVTLDLLNKTSSIVWGPLTLSTSDFTDAQIGLYPNPMHKELTVEFFSREEAKYEIFNTMGQKVLLGKIINGSASVDVEEIPAGFYLINISDKKKTYSKTFVKK